MSDQRVEDTRPIEQPTMHDAVTKEIPVLDPEGAPPPVAPARRRRTPAGRTRLAVVAAAGLLALATAAAFAGPQLNRGTKVGAASPTTVAGVEAAKAPTPTTLGEPARAAAPAVGLVGNGFSRLAPEADGDRKVVYAVVMRNQSSDQLAVGVTARITFTGRGGAALKVEDERLDALLPGQTGAVAGDTDLAGATGMRVQLVVAGWQPAQGLSGQLSAAGVRSAMVAGEFTTSATVRSTLERDLAKADAVAVWYDRAGRVLGGDGDSIDFVPAGGSAPVLIDSSHTPAGIARVAVYASPADLFDDGD